MGRRKKTTVAILVLFAAAVAVAARFASLEKAPPAPTLQINSITSDPAHITIQGAIVGDFKSYSWAQFSVLPALDYERSYIERNHWAKNGFTNLQHPNFSIEQPLAEKRVHKNLIVLTSYVKKPTLFDELRYWLGEISAGGEIEYLLSDPFPIPEETGDDAGQSG
ncbi:MAG: hypothetical protein AAF514_15350 [Verrucomicrobiota bacterium]